MRGDQSQVTLGTCYESRVGGFGGNGGDAGNDASQATS